MKKMLAAMAATTMIAGAALATAPAALAVSPRTTVDAWYTDFLGRDASSDPGSQYWVDRLAAQAPGDVLWAITHAPEHNAQRLDEIYLYSLGRDVASDSGASCWVRGVNDQRFPLEWVQQNVYASPEHTRGKPRDQLVGNWCAGVFTYDITSFGEDNDRFPSRGEIAYWSGRIGAVGPLRAYRELYYTPEAVTHRITDHYQDLLGRNPSPGEIAYWSPKEVESDINVQVLIASTPEYATLAD